MYGYRRITAILRREVVIVNSKKVRRLMKLMNLQAIYPSINTSKRNLKEAIYPYLLSGLEVIKPNQVWQVDITYLRVQSGFMYLVALIDVYTRLVVGYRLSNSLNTESCLLALEDAIAKYGKPSIINSDQGSQFTSEDWINELRRCVISISMTGKGRCNDNAHIERLWRSFKYEGSYLYRCTSVLELKNNIPKWLNWYNNQRPHQALEYKTPFEIYSGFMDKSCDLPTIPLLPQQLQNYKNNIFVDSL
ncbi:IS3 family transposase [Candidatus Tisiphia endosymbiont of Beris chalybata]|uniref:IS3 family transposase n=1 Tax=Candidatus Tisiphia endosymbiont of Beris chalybata TaxID=3066262 RepID=UPI00312CA558